MARQDRHHGYDLDRWVAAREQARGILVGCARRRETIPYSELAVSLPAIRFSPRAPAFHELLAEVCTSADAERGVMLASLVVHKGGDRMPGDGYFSHAAHLGRDTVKRRAFWQDEVAAVYRAFSEED